MPTPVHQIRMPAELIKRVDQYSEFLESQMPGLGVNRSMALRRLVTDALDRFEQSDKRRKRRKANS